MENIEFGPLIKNIYTKELELITKYVLSNPNECEFYTSNNDFFVKIQDRNINLSTLLKYANLSHVELSDVDSILFMSLLGQEHVQDQKTLPYQLDIH